MTHINAITKAIEALALTLQHGRIDNSESRMNSVAEAITALRALRDAKPWLKAEPSTDYDLLKRQFYSMRSLINSLGEQLSFYKKQSYETGEKYLSELRTQLESEKQMNAILTEENAKLLSEAIGE